MRSLVVGASGIVGGYIVERLKAAGEQPMAMSRTARQGRGVDWMVADLSSRQPMAISGVSVLYCTADAGLLADALPYLSLPDLQRVVAFTSTSLMTKLDSEVPEERDHVRRWAEAEQRLIAACAARGVASTILRPTIIYAEGRDANITRLARLIRRLGVMPLAGAGEGLRQPVHAEDLAIGAIAAARTQAAANKIYALPGGETISYREMIGRIFDGLHKPRRVVAIPPALWRLAFAAARPFVANANVAMGMRMSKDLAFDPTPARQDFGWNPRPFRPVFLNLS